MSAARSSSAVRKPSSGRRSGSSPRSTSRGRGGSSRRKSTGHGGSSQRKSIDRGRGSSRRKSIGRGGGAAALPEKTTGAQDLLLSTLFTDPGTQPFGGSKEQEARTTSKRMLRGPPPLQLWQCVRMRRHHHCYLSKPRDPSQSNHKQNYKLRDPNQKLESTKSGPIID